jgi:exosortase A-associated hydrolase 2
MVRTHLARPFFLTGTAGKIYSIYHPARIAVTQRRDLLIVPPFAEEMNRSRRMLALQARALSAAGVGVLIIDLYGTGDSHGDFKEARWEIWRQDVLAALNWLRHDGAAQISLMGLRLGAMLALDCLREQGGPFEKIILWQPVISGESLITQFLRVRFAASMLDSAKEKESTQDLRVTLAKGESVEVAGYDLSPELAADIDRLRLESLVSPNLPPVDWLELVSTEGRQHSPATQRMVENLRRQGTRVFSSTVVGEAFWSLPEITVAPELLHATSQLFFRNR